MTHDWRSMFLLEVLIPCIEGLRVRGDDELPLLELMLHIKTTVKKDPIPPSRSNTKSISSTKVKYILTHNCFFNGTRRPIHKLMYYILGSSVTCRDIVSKILNWYCCLQCHVWLLLREAYIMSVWIPSGCTIVSSRLSFVQENEAGDMLSYIIGFTVL